MKRYDKYKATGIEWLPLIPCHWQLEQLRKYIRLISKKVILINNFSQLQENKVLLSEILTQRRKIIIISQKILVGINM